MTAQTQSMPAGVQILGKVTPEYAQILTPEAMTFVADLHRTFNPTRLALLAARVERQKQFDAGVLPTWLPETADIRSGEWQVAPTPDDLQKRWVEITGPVERKMMINALNSGADVFMADFEDANSPTWENCIDGQINLMDAVRQEMRFTDEAKGKSYELNETIATLLVRPRGWHLVEKHVLIDGAPISASIFDFGLYVFHNMAERLSRGTAPYFYLPKLESHKEARLWNDVFVRAQDKLGAPQGSIKATVLVETVLGALEMEEILYELRQHSAGLNAGRWDYIFSCIKKFRTHSEQVLPDRAQVTMTVPFMKAYTELMVRTCHKRGAHAIGGMAAFIPSRRDAEVNKNAMNQSHRRQGARGQRRLRRHLGGPPGPGAPGPRHLREQDGRQDQPAHGHAGRRGRQVHRRRHHQHRRARRHHHRGRAAPEHRRGAAIRQLLAPGQRRRGHLQPDGGRGHRRDLPLPDLAVDPQWGQAR